MDKQKSCCFTGHRPHKLPFGREEEHPSCLLLKQRLTAAILNKAIEYGCDTFLCGMAEGADLICAELVLALDEMLACRLRLVCVVPCLSQAAAWDRASQERYKAILGRADEKILISRAYTKSCMHERNRFLVEHAAHMIAVFDGVSPGGTMSTVRYAQRRGLLVDTVSPIL